MAASDRAVRSGPVGAAPAGIRPAATSPSTTTCRTNCSREFLDETMTYSSALFETLPAPWPDLADGATAQDRPAARRRPESGAGSRVLEIGTGWGELCIRAAARGAHVRSVTLSAEQQRLARQRVAAARAVRPGADRPARLPRRRRMLRRRGVGRDDRGGGIPRVAAIFRRRSNGWCAGRAGRDPGHHHAARPDAGQPQHPHLDPEVHLPRRADPVHPRPSPTSPSGRPVYARST